MLTSGNGTSKTPKAVENATPSLSKSLVDKHLTAARAEAANSAERSGS